MIITEEILFHPITIIISTFSVLTPFYHFKRNEEGIAHTYAPTILKEKNTFIRKLLLWSFGGKNTQFRIYYYARKITWITLIFAIINLFLMFIFEWYRNPSFVSIYYCFLFCWMLIVEGIPVLLISIHDHIVKKEKKKIKK